MNYPIRVQVNSRVTTHQSKRPYDFRFAAFEKSHIQPVLIPDESFPGRNFYPRVAKRKTESMTRDDTPLGGPRIAFTARKLEAYHAILVGE